jgi:hypothetical protein
VSVCPSVYIYEKSTKASISAKPMTIDPIFWDIVGLPENNNAPLSFRFNGAWTCRPPPFDEVSIDERGDVEEVAARLLEAANEHLTSAVRCLSGECFLRLCQTSGATEDSYLPCVITTLIALGLKQEALETAKTAKVRGVRGGFIGPEDCFTDMAITWLDAAVSRDTKH